jgi:hypothetical protein
VARSHDDFLLIRLREVGNSAPAGKPWRGQELCKLAERTSRQVAGHTGLYLQFMEGICDLASEEDDRITGSFASRNAELRRHREVLRASSGFVRIRRTRRDSTYDFAFGKR